MVIDLNFVPWHRVGGGVLVLADLVREHAIATLSLSLSICNAPIETPAANELFNRWPESQHGRGNANSNKDKYGAHRQRAPNEITNQTHYTRKGNTARNCLVWNVWL